MTSETLVCQTQDVCGRFQSENWAEHECIEKCKMLQKSHLYKTTTLSSFCFLTYPNNFMLFL